MRRIGQGGMGVVYEAEQNAPQRRVLLKGDSSASAASSFLIGLRTSPASSATLALEQRGQAGLERGGVLGEERLGRRGGVRAQQRARDGHEHGRGVARAREGGTRGGERALERAFGEGAREGCELGARMGGARAACAAVLFGRPHVSGSVHELAMQLRRLRMLRQRALALRLFAVVVHDRLRLR